MQIICGRTSSCGFRVHDRYFVDKPRFNPGACPVCNGPLVVVDDYTDIPVLGRSVDYNPNSPTFRRIA